MALSLDDHLAIVAQLEKLLSESNDKLDTVRFAATAQTILAEAPNKEVLALTTRIVQGLDRTGRRKREAQLDREHLADMVLRLRVTLEALKRVDPSLH